MRYEYNITDHLGNVRLSYTDKDNDGVIEQASGEVLTETHYYPFGMNMDGPWITGGDNQYLYNGKEWENDHGLGLIDYGARWLDPSTGRWNAADPLSQNYYSMSPYLYCASNPIKYVDPDGRYFTERSLTHLNNMEDDMQSRENRFDKKIARAKRKGNDEKVAELEKQKAAAVAEFEVVRLELANMAESNQGYDIFVDRINNSSNPYSNETGGARFNFSNGLFEVRIPNASNMGLLSHELKHAYQFEIGKFSSSATSDPSKTPGNGLYDQWDEVEAYQRGEYFGGTSNINSPADLDQEVYGELEGRQQWDSTNHIHIKTKIKRASLQAYADKWVHAYRINGVTYYKRQ